MDQNLPEPEVSYILPAEHLGWAETKDGILNIGGLDVRVGQWARQGEIPVFVRRDSADLSIIEIHMARHDGLAQEELDRQSAEADRYPLGLKEYWRAEMVGKYTYGLDGHSMTDEEFEADWAESDLDEDAE